MPRLPYPISNAVLGSLVVFVDGEKLHRTSSPALVHRADLRQGQNLSTQQVPLHGRGVNLEWNGVATCGEPGHETRESGRLGNEAMSPTLVSFRIPRPFPPLLMIACSMQKLEADF